MNDFSNGNFNWLRPNQEPVRDPYELQPLSGDLNQMVVQLGGNSGRMIGRALFGNPNQKRLAQEQEVFSRLATESQVHGDPAQSLLNFSASLAQRGFHQEALKAQQAALKFQEGGDQVIQRQQAKAAEEAAKAEEAQIAASLNEAGDLSSMTPEQLRVIEINAMSDPRAKAKALQELKQQQQQQEQEAKIRQGAINAMVKGGVPRETATLLADDPKQARVVLMKAAEGTYMTPRQAQAARDKQLSQAQEGNQQSAKQLQETQAELQSHDATLVNIQAAKDIFAKGQATGSGFGAMVDGVYRFTGNTNEGMKASRELKVISGRLALSVPRFSGPQSDKDVALYRETVADVGNEQLTLEERQAALLQAEALVLKAQEQAQGRLVQSGDLRPTPANAARVTGSQPPVAPAAGGRLNLNNYVTK